MKRVFVLLIASISILITPFAQSQSFRYIDESGNIHFVDSVSQIPPRYRNQVLEPTPVITGKVKKLRNTPTPKPTRTPRPTKTPKIKKTKAPRGKSFFPGSYSGTDETNQQRPARPANPYAPPVPKEPYNFLNVPPGQFPPDAAPPAPTSIPAVSPAL